MPKPARAPVMVKHIAQHTGPSIMTVSRVVRGRPDVSPASRRKVLTAVRRLGYIPNPAAQLLCGSIRAAAILSSGNRRPPPVLRPFKPTGRASLPHKLKQKSTRNHTVEHASASVRIRPAKSRAVHPGPLGGGPDRRSMGSGAGFGAVPDGWR